ncbi:hypothetical protein OG920_25040 [Streptomyces europaeiscabiei]|uniref:hypothetical protein n=1 Tax=Streptomyces europaeiscabiei TaxID=146819 RepID=UPI0029B975AD|nr:hypothetical protein [Streptomyces europaeiscabiei]MDX3587483.1 hypothetical protein [Streptomyces europaeiscabiei]MDX3620020.1 hypothetical protein [Streptomyces europaeiscabiei]WUD34405.1 hypothetical protein OG858_25370 [Streptomyces europaeiscabiei]
MRQLAILSAAFAVLLPTASPAVPATAPATPAAVPPGHVYFWPERGQMGPGGAWDYAPGGYREADARVKRHAYSFDSHAPISVFAIHYKSGGGCLYREIRPDDYDDDWSDWATKFDGVSDTRMGCEAG